MSLEVRNILNANEWDKERVVLKVESDLDIGDWVLLAANRYSTGGPASGAALAYWFPDKRLKAGDLVVVYTKGGRNSEKALATGNTSHFFYWGKTEPCWNDYTVPVVGEMAVWNYSDPKAASVT